MSSREEFLALAETFSLDVACAVEKPIEHYMQEACKSNDVRGTCDMQRATIDPDDFYRPFITDAEEESKIEATVYCRRRAENCPTISQQPTAEIRAHIAHIVKLGIQASQPAAKN